eukprot:3990780-Pleurochrysis_carterae.AAC.1
MPYKWGHHVATLPETNGTIVTSHSQNDGNSAIYHPFLGHESNMPGSDPNHLAHQQPNVVMRRADARFRSQPPDHSPKSIY